MATWEWIVIAVVVLIALWLLFSLLPDILRYMRMRKM